MKREKFIVAMVQSADFIEDTITLKLPKGFWDEHDVKCGKIEIPFVDSDDFPIQEKD